MTEGTLFFSFFETVFTLTHAIPSNLHLAESNKENCDAI